MKSRISIAAIMVAVLTLGLTVLAGLGNKKPDFSPGVYADGEAWGTKGTTAIPAPNEHNMQSFDPLVVITNGAPGQLPIGEAAPGNRYYNGGRWITFTAAWNASGMAAHNPLPVLKSYDEFMIHWNLGHLDVELGSFEGGPPPYFQCPLLPVKEE